MSRESALNMTVLTVLDWFSLRSSFPVAASRIITSEEEQVATSLPSGLKLTHEVVSSDSRFQIASLFCVARSHSSRICLPVDSVVPGECLTINVQAITKNFPSGLIANTAGWATVSQEGLIERDLKLE